QYRPPPKPLQANSLRGFFRGPICGPALGNESWKRFCPGPRRHPRRLARAWLDVAGESSEIHEILLDFASSPDQVGRLNRRRIPASTTGLEEGDRCFAPR